MSRILAAALLTLSLGLSVYAQADPPAQLRDSVEKILQADARGWVFNRYDASSVRNVRVLERAADGHSGIVYGEYTYNGGQLGWVKLHIKNGQLDCLEFWDFAGVCRPLGQSPSAAAALAVIAAAVAMTSSNYGGSPGEYDACVRACHDAPTPQGYGVEQACIRDRCTAGTEAPVGDETGGAQQHPSP